MPPPKPTTVSLNVTQVCLARRAVLEHRHEGSRHRRRIAGEHRVDPVGARRDLPQDQEHDDQHRAATPGSSGCAGATRADSARRPGCAPALASGRWREARPGGGSGRRPNGRASSDMAASSRRCRALWDFELPACSCPSSPAIAPDGGRARPRWSGSSPRTRRICAPRADVGRVDPKLGKLMRCSDLMRPGRRLMTIDAVGHADRLADVVGHEDDGLVLGREDAGDLVRQRETRLVVERRERLVEQQESGSGHNVRASAARWRMPPESWLRQAVHELAETVAPQQLLRAAARNAHVETEQLGADQRHCPARCAIPAACPSGTCSRPAATAR